MFANFFNSGRVMKLNIVAIIIFFSIHLLICRVIFTEAVDLASESSTCRIHTGERIPTNLPFNSSFDLYKQHTCYHCYKFIMAQGRKLPLLDRHNPHQMNDVCQKDQLPDDCKRRITECCIKAEECCLLQLKQGQEEDLSVTRNQCPITWDGILCVNFTKPNSYAKLKCPGFMHNFLPTTYGSKYCTPNATWRIKTDENITWEPSDYIPCTSLKKKQNLIFMLVELGFFCLSYAFLTISIIIFLSFKALRDQPRIRLHINLFFALQFRSMFGILAAVIYELPVYQTMSGEEDTDSVVFEGESSWCIGVTIANLYFQDTTYFWVFCEALFLYRLLTNTFEQRSSIMIYSFIGWGLPFILKSIYFCSIALLPLDDQQRSHCWVYDTGVLAWLSRSPYLICLAGNFIFLLNILRVMKNLNSINNESSSFKRSLRACFILIPLFGLQSLFVSYQPPDNSSDFYLAYNIISKIIVGSHGFLVSFVFCLYNDEVLSVMKRWWNRQNIFPCCKRMRPINSRMSSMRANSSNSVMSKKRFGSHDSKNSLPMIPLLPRKSRKSRNSNSSSRNQSLPDSQLTTEDNKQEKAVILQEVQFNGNCIIKEEDEELSSLSVKSVYEDIDQNKSSFKELL